MGMVLFVRASEDVTGSMLKLSSLNSKESSVIGGGQLVYFRILGDFVGDDDGLARWSKYFTVG